MTKTKSFLDLLRHVACSAGFLARHPQHIKSPGEKRKSGTARTKRGFVRITVESRRFRAAKTTRLYTVYQLAYTMHHHPPSSRS